MKRFTFTAVAVAAAISAVALPVWAQVMVGGAPMYSSKDIVDNAVQSKDHTTLVAAVKAADLVDTAILTCTGVEVREVSGSCFCCNFPGFMAAVQSLIDAGCDLIVAEPVGSCTDLSATILQPVKDKFPDLDLAPLTVLVDPVRLKEALELVQTLTHPDALYIVKRQLEEADRILLNKADTLTPAQSEEELALLKQNFTATAAAVSAGGGKSVEAAQALAVLGYSQSDVAAAMKGLDVEAFNGVIQALNNAVSGLQRVSDTISGIFH